jgi:hypothetical protein
MPLRVRSADSEDYDCYLPSISMQNVRCLPLNSYFLQAHNSQPAKVDFSTLFAASDRCLILVRLILNFTFFLFNYSQLDL